MFFFRRKKATEEQRQELISEGQTAALMVAKKWGTAKPSFSFNGSLGEGETLTPLINSYLDTWLAI